MNKKKFRFWLVFTILWLIVIFGHSAMPSNVSSQESLGVLSWLNKLLPNLSHDTLRKLGHLAEFAVLGIGIREVFSVWSLCTEIKFMFAHGKGGSVWRRLLKT